MGLPLKDQLHKASFGLPLPLHAAERANAWSCCCCPEGRLQIETDIAHDPDFRILRGPRNVRCGWTPTAVACWRAANDLVLLYARICMTCCVRVQPVRAAPAAVAVPADRGAAAAALQTILGIAVKLSDVGADPSATMPASTATVVDVPVAASGDVSEGAGSRAIRNALTRTRLVGSQALAGLCAAFQRGVGVSGVDQAFVDFWLDRCV